MERTKSAKATNVVALQNKLQTLSVLVERAKLMSRLGQSYDNKRDLYKALGYKLTLDYNDFATYYLRNEMAKAVINRPVEATWRGVFGIEESKDTEETALEKAWNELSKLIPLKQVFSRLDKLASLGKYGILFLGLDDAKSTADFAKPVEAGKGRKLLYVKPYGEGSAPVLEYESNTSNARYGLPTFYNVKVVTNPGTETSVEVRIHQSRVIHVTGEILESEYEGIPTLEVLFNRIMDLEKLVGGSAEMFWRGARPGYQGKVDPDYQMTSETEDGLRDQIDEYENNLRRILVNQGVDLTALTQQVSDPKNHVDVQIQMISAVTGIPKRILTGSELGELASSEDKGSWLSLITARRAEYAELQIVRPFVDRCVLYGVFPKATNDYSVMWEDLFAPSAKEQADIGNIRSAALKNYTSTPTAEQVVPHEAFYEFFLGLDAEEIELITEMKATAVTEEEAFMQKAQAEGLVDENGNPIPAPPEPVVKPAPAASVPKKAVIPVKGAK